MNTHRTTGDDLASLPRSEQKAARRQQLLDAAADLLVDKGLTGLTMEALATAAGVSKALPYRHFDNANGVVVALYEREIGELTVGVGDAIAGLSDGEEIITAALHAYFEIVEERGMLLKVLAGTGSQVPAMVHGDQPPGPDGLTVLVKVAYGLEGPTAALGASLLAACAISATETVERGDATREEAEKATTAALVAAMEALARL